MINEYVVEENYNNKKLQANPIKKIKDWYESFVVWICKSNSLDYLDKWERFHNDMFWNWVDQWI